MIKILHNRIPFDEYGNPIVTGSECLRIHNYLKKIVEKLDEQYIVITTSTELTCLNDNDVILQIDAKKYTYDELKEIFEKANNYDSLCK